MTGKCVVFQPFDNGPFDKRYDEIIAPAIEAANLDPYRVDRDPSAVVLVDKLHAEIRSADVCLADVSRDNPNVWYELGYAMACDRPTVIVCSTERTSFPFDIQRLRIIRYASDSSSDFEKLKRDIVETLEAQAVKAKVIPRIAAESQSNSKKTGDLTAPEMAALALVKTNERINNWISKLREDMGKAGFSHLVADLAIKSLARRALVKVGTSVDENSGEEASAVFVTDAGEDWLISNLDKIEFQTKLGRGTMNNEEILKSAGFTRYEKRDLWFNREQKKCFSHEVLRDRSQKWLDGALREQVPRGKFRFYRNTSDLELCAEILIELGQSDHIPDESLK